MDHKAVCLAVAPGLLFFAGGIVITQGQATWIPINHWLAPSLFAIALAWPLGVWKGHWLMACFGRLDPSRHFYRIEVIMNSGDDPKEIHEQLIEAYIEAHPDPGVAAQLRDNVMSPELAEAVRDWLQPRLASWGISGELRLRNFVIKPPAAIRLDHARGMEVSENDIAVDPGISAIDAEYSEDSPIRRNKIRIQKQS